MKDIFLKKRMNLLILSLVVYFIETTDIKIEKINILGTDIVVENPNIINVWIWVFFIYFLIMYYYYFKIVEKDSEFEYRSTLTKYMVYSHYVNSKYIDKVGGLHKIYYDKYPSYVHQDSEFEIKDMKILLHFKRNVIESNGNVYSESVYPVDLAIDISKTYYIYCIVKSFIQTSLVTKYFFESYLPFVIAFIVISTKIFSLF